MVVDAARSAEMKSHADSLAIEYSFREYQEWIAQISGSLRGRVHSTAGDGAIVSFPSAPDAFLAARRLQTDLERFNREVNRLPSPFRLRIGLHVGEVAGDLGKVEFAEVIDVAAHVQGASPVGGIAATEEAVAGLAREEFVPLADQVDGHRVYLAMNPTEG
jgi:class 3 adenylate cyclase